MFRVLLPAPDNWAGVSAVNYFYTQCHRHSLVSTVPRRFDILPYWSKCSWSTASLLKLFWSSSIKMNSCLPFSLKRRFSRARSTSSWMALVCCRTWKTTTFSYTVLLYLHCTLLYWSADFFLTLEAHCLHCFSSRQSPAALARLASSGLSFRSNHFRLWKQRHT